MYIIMGYVRWTVDTDVFMTILMNKDRIIIIIVEYATFMALSRFKKYTINMNFHQICKEKKLTINLHITKRRRI